MSLDHKSEDLRKQLAYVQLVPLPDEVLMCHLQSGNLDALAVLFHRYHNLVLSVALRILRDAGEAEDLMQSVFLEILRSADHFDPSKGTTKVWILQYTYCRGFNRRQYLSLRGIYDRSEDSALIQKSMVGNYRNSLAAPESARALQEALSRLSKMQRKTLELAFYEGMTMHEIAQKTDESFDSVRHHYYRGLQKLRSILCEAPEVHSRNSCGESMAHVRS